MATIRVFGTAKKQKTDRPKPESRKVVVSVGQTHGRDDTSWAREIIQDARDEAFRLKKAAEEETRKIKEKTLEI